MRNALLGSIAVWLAGANLLCAQPGRLALQPATDTPPAAATDPGTADAKAKPDAGAPGITPDGDAPPLPWIADWANDLFGTSY